MKAVYRAPYAIPELGVRPGDIITVRPSHPDHPLVVGRALDRNQLPAILDHLDHLTPLHLSPSAESVSQLRQELLRRFGQPPAPPSTSGIPEARRPLRLVK